MSKLSQTMKMVSGSTTYQIYTILYDDRRSFRLWCIWNGKCWWNNLLLSVRDMCLCGNRVCVQDAVQSNQRKHDVLYVNKRNCISDNHGNTTVWWNHYCKWRIRHVVYGGKRIQRNIRNNDRFRIRFLWLDRSIRYGNKYDLHQRNSKKLYNFQPPWI